MPMFMCWFYGVIGGSWAAVMAENKTGTALQRIQEVCLQRCMWWVILLPMWLGAGAARQELHNGPIGLLMSAFALLELLIPFWTHVSSKLHVFRTFLPGRTAQLVLQIACIQVVSAGVYRS